MSFYENYCLPIILDCACSMKAVDQQRAVIVPQAQGRILEVGMGSGLNLKHYDSSMVEKLWGLEPSEGMRRKAEKNIAQSDIEVEWLGLPSERIPLEDNCIDTVVLTYTLCTIANWSGALAEMHRVMQPNGRLLFCEHGEAPDASVRKWQQRINPVWRKLMGGCNLDRRIPSLIRAGGFDIKSMDAGYIDGPKIAAYQYSGLAVLR